ncbi:hypothetical protein GCM10008967_25930 [Bacillus carboniphilus]|uniref:Uncharacterized protein n=1 Tax=Bacillus carboniphilus TaxID=86663 RepID=A0ABN0WEC4_9BACI
MLVDINLIQKPKQRNTPLFILAGFALLSFALVITTGILWYNGELQMKDRLENQLAHVQELRGIREQQNQPIETVTPTKQYEETVQWMDDYPLSTVVVIDEIRTLLTDRGFILQFDYSSSERIHLVAQFDASREVAFFFERLQASPLFTNVVLNKIETVKLDNGNPDVLPRYRADFNLAIQATEVQKAKKESGQ